MKGVVVERYGAVEESLVYREDLPMPPDPQDDEVLVRVLAAGTNPVDYKLARGDLSVVMSPGAFPWVVGLDLAGVVAKVGGGAAATTFKVGDEVYGRASLLSSSRPGRGGSYAEYTLASLANVAPKPPSLSMQEAAGLPVAALTALVGLKHYGGVKAGERVLIFGGSGGVGSAAVQVAAHALGAGAVAATCSAKNTDYVKSLGATDVYDYCQLSSAEIVATAKPDVVLDCVGGAEIWRACSGSSSCRCFVTAVGDDAGAKLTVPRALAFGTRLAVRKTRAAVGWGPQYHFISSLDSLPLTEVTALVEEGGQQGNHKRGRLRVEVEQVLPLQEARQALERLQTHRTRGKVILKVAEQ